MKRLTLLYTLLLIYSSLSVFAQLPQEYSLWKNGIVNNPVKYAKEVEDSVKVRDSALSHKNRFFRYISEPTYSIHQPEKGKANGIAMVICPGGAFREVWLDREGHDFAIWLAEQGITSLVLKYRTYNADAEGFSLDREVYNREVYADAKQAINILRSKADELGLDKNKIGISGFSAGGALSLYATLNIYDNELPEYANFTENTQPNFACLIYPGVRDVFFEAIPKLDSIPPIFMINAENDDKTPVERCLKLYSALVEKKVPAELHIYAKGWHGFDSGFERGFAMSSWHESFIAWMKDMEIMK